MNEPIETLDVEGITVQIFQDRDAQNPEAMSDAPIYLFHKHRDFDYAAKELPFTPTREGFASWIEDRHAAAEAEPQWLVFSLESYIHSGVVLALKDSVRAASFPDRQWDVSRCGWVFIDTKAWNDRMGLPEDSELRRHAATDWRKIAEAHVHEWNQYLGGDVYGFIINRPDEQDSCWGFYGIEAAREAGEDSAKVWAARDRKEAEAFAQFIASLDEGALDEIVLECKSREASQVNNGGPIAQVRYILDEGFYTKDRLLEIASAKGK